MPEKSTFEKRHKQLCWNASFRWSLGRRVGARRARAAASWPRISSKSWRCSFLTPVPSPAEGTSKMSCAGGLLLRPSALRASPRRDYTRSISDSSTWAQALSEAKKVSHLVASLPSLNETALRVVASDGHSPGFLPPPVIWGRMLLRVLRKTARRSVLR